MDDSIKFPCTHYDVQTSLYRCTHCSDASTCDLFATMLAEHEDMTVEEALS